MEKLINQFMQVARKKTPGYMIDAEKQSVIELLLLYFTNNPEFETQKGIKFPSLTKGILLAGNNGSGKSELMEILQACRFKGKQFGIKTAREIAQIYANDGFKGIEI